jgi:hypothetical protein
MHGQQQWKLSLSSDVAMFLQVVYGSLQGKHFRTYQSFPLFPVLI